MAIDEGMLSIDQIPIIAYSTESDEQPRVIHRPPGRSRR